MRRESDKTASLGAPGPGRRPSSPPPAPIHRILRPFQEFSQIESSGGILLLVATVIALIWANSPWANGYRRLWETSITLGVGSFVLAKPLLFWINDGLMAVFFFVVGLEIKREVLVGELASFRQAALPIAGALGGMIVPAALYVAINPRQPGLNGWGIPMATDIAFMVGALALLGTRIPTGLKVFLVALAIADDIGAVLIIAFFYTDHLSWLSLAIAAGFLATLVTANILGVRHPLLYAALAFGLWLAMLKSGVHPTIAGVLAAFTIPARPRIDAVAFLHTSRSILSDFEAAAIPGSTILTNEREQSAVQALEGASESVQAPMQRLEHGLLPWVNMLIVPGFALANAGVTLSTGAASALFHPVSLGVIAGLVLGKPLGIFAAVWLAVRTGFAALPAKVDWGHIFGAGALGGIGFTMSIFIAGLAYENSPLLNIAKLGILAASIIAASAGSISLLRGAPNRPEETT